MMEKYINDCGKECYRGVSNETKFSDLEFHEAADSCDEVRQWAIHTNIGSLTVVDRLTGFSGYVRDTETGFRDTEGEFWLATGMFDIREKRVETIGEAIDLVKATYWMLA